MRNTVKLHCKGLEKIRYIFVTSDMGKILFCKIWFWHVRFWSNRGMFGDWVVNAVYSRVCYSAAKLLPTTVCYDEGVVHNHYVINIIGSYSDILGVVIIIKLPPFW